MGKTILEQVVDRMAKPHCAACNGRFGLIRYRYAHKQFCSRQCLERYLVEDRKRVSASDDGFLSLEAARLNCGSARLPQAGGLRKKIPHGTDGASSTRHSARFCLVYRFDSFALLRKPEWLIYC